MSTSSDTPLLTRKQLATRCGLSLRTIDDLLSKALLPFFRFGKSIRFDPAEVEATLRERFHVQPRAKKAIKGRSL